MNDKMEKMCTIPKNVLFGCNKLEKAVLYFFKSL